MKKTISITLMTLVLCVCMLFGLTGCANQEDINTAIAPISEQITAINTSIDDLKAVDTQLDGYIDALETKVTELEASDTATADEITAIKTIIETLKTKDAELDGKITTLENYVNTELSETEDWAEATFATLAQYAEIQNEISSIKNTLTNLVDTNELSAAISTSESGMKEWVNKALADGYYTIVEIDTKLSELETKLNSADDTLEVAIEEQKMALANAKIELTTAYTNAINEAIEEHDGKITQKIAEDIDTAKAELQTQLDGIKEEINEIKADIATLNSTISALQNKIAELENRINCLEGNHAFEGSYEVSYKWADDYTTCTATQVCARTNCDVENELTATSVSVSGTTLTATFDGVESTTIDITTIENQDYIVATGENNNSTYVIYNKTGLDAWKTAASSNVSTNLTLACDIEYNASWAVPVITYKGVIDGNGYAIKGLYSAGTAVSYFVSCSTFIYKLDKGGVIKHLGMVGGTLTNDVSGQGSGSFGFVYENSGTIMGCYNTSACTNETWSDEYGSAAGVCYQNTGTIIACYNAGALQGAGDYVAGISAISTSSITGCYNTGVVSGGDSDAGYYATAITSKNTGNINNCYYTEPEYGYRDSGASPTVMNKISGNDWTDAMNAMNTAIETYNETATVKCNYRYALNTDTSTNVAQPLIIVEVEVN